MSEQKHIYTTIRGIALSMKLEFPFHASAGGADYYVLHGNVSLEDGSGLHAEIAVHMSQAVKQVAPGLDEQGALGPAVNAIRKSTDTRDIEFLKSGKRQPIRLSSREYSILKKEFTFQNPDEAGLAEFLQRKIYWDSKLKGKSWVADPVEALYVRRSPEQLLSAAKELETQGLCRLEGESAIATAGLSARGAEFEDAMRTALHELDEKHAFERG